MEFRATIEYITSLIKRLVPTADINVGTGSAYTYHFMIYLEDGKELPLSFTHGQMKDFEYTLVNDSPNDDRRRAIESVLKFKIYILLGNAGAIPGFNVSEELLNEKRDWLKTISFTVHYEKKLYDKFFEGLTTLSMFLKASLDIHGQYVPEYKDELDRVEQLRSFYSEKGTFGGERASVETLGYFKAATVCWIIGKERQKEVAGIPKRVVKKIDEDIYYAVTQLRESPFFQIKMPEFIHEYATQIKREGRASQSPYSDEKAELLDNWVPFASNKAVFLAHRFDEKDIRDKVVSELGKAGFNVKEGKLENIGYISEDILTKIKESGFFLALLTPSKEFKDASFSTSSWILMEIGAAIAFGRIVLILAEDCIDREEYAGKLQRDCEHIVFSRDNFDDKLKTAIARIIKEWERQNRA